MGHIILLIRDLRASEETFSPVVHIHSSLIYYVRSRGQCSVLEDSVKSPTQTCLCFCVLCSAVDGQRLLPPPMGQPQGTLQIRTGFLGRDPPGAGSPREHTASPGSVMTELIFWSPSFACTEKILWIFFFFFFFYQQYISSNQEVFTNKLLAWGIFHERFYICLVHGSSKLLCLSQSGKLTEQ